MSPKSMLSRLFSSRRETLQLLAIVAVTLTVMAVLTVTFGIHPTGPSYDLIADPGAGLPF